MPAEVTAKGFSSKALKSLPWKQRACPRTKNWLYNYRKLKQSPTNQVQKPGPLCINLGGMGREVGGRLKREGRYGYPRLIEVWH